jgi:hypothetical protein
LNLTSLVPTGTKIGHVHETLLQSWGKLQLVRSKEADLLLLTRLVNTQNADWFYWYRANISHNELTSKFMNARLKICATLHVWDTSVQPHVSHKHDRLPPPPSSSLNHILTLEQQPQRHQFNLALPILPSQTTSFE